MTFDEFLRGVVSDCVNGSSGSIYRPGLEEPPTGTLCPVCSEALRLYAPGYCGECGWREEDGSVMHVRCCGCGKDIGTKPCVRSMAGATSHGSCPDCLRGQRLAAGLEAE